MDRLRARLGWARPLPPPPEPRLPEGGWEGMAGVRVVSVCHPDWRGVRSSAYSHRAPVVEIADAGAGAGEAADRLAEAGVAILVVHGFPPGTERLLDEATGSGLATRLVLYSSMAQHAGEPVETQVINQVVELLREGPLERLGFAKEGQAEAFQALGVEASFVPNRVPDIPPFEPLSLGDEHLQVGVFAEPFWRKNVATQLGAVALLGNARAHLVHRPDLAYLDRLPITEHGLLPYPEFLRLQGSVDLNLYVTLSECMPLTPLESYACRVPCLASRTSALFRSDPELWELTTVDEADNPVAVARAARRLLEHRQEAVERARRWMEAWDEEAARLWAEFLGAAEAPL